jgi:hypothetical protein
MIVRIAPKRRKRQTGVAAFAVIVAVTLAVLPMLGALHQAEHFSETVASAASESTILASLDGTQHENSATCQLCKATARTKHSCRPYAQIVAFLRNNGAFVIVDAHPPSSRIALPLPPARAPPIA